MIGKIPAVFKINMKINRIICFFVPAFQSAIPFQIVLRIINTTNNIIVHWLYAAGIALVAKLPVSVSIRVNKK